MSSSVVNGRPAPSWWSSTKARRIRSKRVWEDQYVGYLFASDGLVIAAAVALAQVVRFGREDTAVVFSDVGYTGLSIALWLLWFAMLAVFRTRSPRVIGTGPEEYRRIVSATFRLFGLLAIVSLISKLEFARGYLAIAFPVGLAGIVAERWLWRRRIAKKRTAGDFQTAVLVIGSRSSVRSMVSHFQRHPQVGYTVVGVCLPGVHSDEPEDLLVGGVEIPVYGDENDVHAALEMSGADTVAVTATEHLGAAGIRKLVWELEPHNVDLVVAPGVVDVAGPRLVMRPVADLPLIHVEKPQYNGAKRFGKVAFDFCFALCALVVALPVLVVCAVVIKTTSRGPIFYRSERIGLDGKPFQMIKFRSMVVDADRQLQTLLASNESRGGVLFKMKEDPRVTGAGKFMRRFSIDELPQFFNVLRREMSVVGPRPPLRREVDTYDFDVSRRLLVKPGLTGLWQVSGRSDLSWDESVRLDLSYVENWSMVSDLVIIGKTLNAVTKREGAY